MFVRWMYSRCESCGKHEGARKGRRGRALSRRQRKVEWAGMKDRRERGKGEGGRGLQGMSGGRERAEGGGGERGSECM